MHLRLRLDDAVDIAVRLEAGPEEDWQVRATAHVTPPYLALGVERAPANGQARQLTWMREPLALAALLALAVVLWPGATVHRSARCPTAPRASSSPGLRSSVVWRRWCLHLGQTSRGSTSSTLQARNCGHFRSLLRRRSRGWRRRARPWLRRGRRRRSARRDWTLAGLLRRTFALAVFACSGCGGRGRVLHT